MSSSFAEKVPTLRATVRTADDTFVTSGEGNMSPIIVATAVSAGTYGVSVRGMGRWVGTAGVSLSPEHRRHGCRRLTDDDHGAATHHHISDDDHHHPVNAATVDHHHDPDDVAASRGCVRWGVCGAGVDPVGLLDRGGIGVERLDRHRA